MRLQLSGLCTLLLLGLAVSQECPGYNSKLKQNFDRYTFMIEVPEALFPMAAADSNGLDGNVFAMLGDLSESIVVNRSAPVGGMGSITYLPLTEAVDVALAPMAEIVDSNITGPEPLGPHVVTGPQSLVIYNPPLGLYKSIKSGLVADAGTFLEKSLTFYCDVSPLASIKFAEGGDPLPITQIAEVTELNPGLKPVVDLFENSTGGADTPSTTYVRRLYWPMTFEGEPAGAAIATVNYKTMEDAVQGAQPSAASIALTAASPDGSSLYSFALPDANMTMRFAMELQRVAGVLQLALNELAGEVPQAKAAQPDPNTFCPPPPGASCPSTFYSLPKTYDGDQLFLLAYSDATAAAVAGDFCTARGFGGAGAVKKQELPIYLTAVADQWRTYDPQTQQACQGTTCVAIAVIECYNAGGAPLGLDGNGNVGCGNSGSGSTGSWNSGSNNRGSCNSGSNDVGDSNAGSNVIGSFNQASNTFGNNNTPSIW